LLLNTLQRLSCSPYRSVRKGHLLLEPYSQELFVFLQKLDLLGYLDLPAFWSLSLPPVLQFLKSYFHVKVGVLEGSLCVPQRRASVLPKVLYGLDRFSRARRSPSGFTFCNLHTSFRGVVGPDPSISALSLRLCRRGARPSQGLADDLLR
jgi:hypothetical protein